jgi:anti-sigma regulatory factor (Ser/Thr protein kinase)
MMTALTLPGVPESAAAARALTAKCLAGSPAAGDAVLCVDELFANAVLHSASGLPGGKVTVVVSTGGGAARVDVIDAGPLPSGARGPGGLGQGIMIVSQLADAFGADGTDRWFTVATAGRVGEDLCAVAALLEEAGLAVGQDQREAEADLAAGLAVIVPGGAR